MREACLRIDPFRDYLANHSTSDWVEPRDHSLLHIVKSWRDYVQGYAEPADAGLREFERLADAWESETLHLSSVTQIVLNQNYQQIIGMGNQVVPLILERLSKSPGHWFWALSAITKENPVSPDDAGDLDLMASAWITWGRSHGLL